MFILLNMRSTTTAPHASAGDLTTRARIREAAITRFARDGFGAPLRTIAADAGVSAALIVHLFGSKDGLRDACDEQVFERIRTVKRAVIVEDAGPGSFLMQLAVIDSYAPLVSYVVRSLMSGGDHARAFVEHMVADAVAYVREGVAAGRIVPSRDEEARIRYLVGAALGPLLLEFSLNPPSDPVAGARQIRDYLGRITLPALELFTEGFLADRSMLDAYLLYVTDPPADADSATHPDDKEAPA